MAWTERQRSPHHHDVVEELLQVTELYLDGCLVVLLFDELFDVVAVCDVDVVDDDTLDVGRQVGECLADDAIDIHK